MKGKGVNKERERLDKINELWSMIKNSEVGIKKDYLIANFCLKYGATRRRVLEYLKILIDARKIKEKDGRYL